eukprot:jgi/Chlat1/3844/Chrsp26S03978
MPAAVAVAGSSVGLGSASPSGGSVAVHARSRRPASSVAARPQAFNQHGWLRLCEGLQATTTGGRSRRNLCLVTAEGQYGWYANGASQQAAAREAGELRNELFMLKALELARKAMGKTAPNPMVGCVIVRDEEASVVGEGFHPKAGEPHAEVFALRQAGDKAEGATAYVSLEPCNHYGRTPPCTQALINAQVKKVFIGCVDKNPLVAGKGVKALQAAGIEVVVGVCEHECLELNEAFFFVRAEGHALNVLHSTLAADGQLLYPTAEAHVSEQLSRLRLEADALVVDASTSELVPPTDKPVFVVGREATAHHKHSCIAASPNKLQSQLAEHLSSKDYNLVLWEVIDPEYRSAAVEQGMVDKLSISVVPTVSPSSASVDELQQFIITSEVYLKQ